jgi:hypothetical protein
MKVVIFGARERSSVKKLVELGRLPLNTEAEKAQLKDWVFFQNAAEKHFPADVAAVDALIGRLQERYRSHLVIVTAGCDDGIGYLVKISANRRRIRRVEISSHFYTYPETPNARGEYLQFYLARNAFMDEVGDEFHFFVTNNRHSIAEDLYGRVTAKTMARPNIRPFTVYNESNEIIETNAKDTK